MNPEIKNILFGTVGKLKDKGTISIKFKHDICEWALTNKKFCQSKTAVELGTCLGYTTRVLSHLFDKVVTFDNLPDRIYKAKKYNSDRNNIEFCYEDLYDPESRWWENVDNVGLVFIDASHEYEHIKRDIDNVLKLNRSDNMLIIFDDYGMFPEVKLAVMEYIEQGRLQPVQYLGHPKGFYCPECTIRIPAVSLDHEGVMCLVKK